MEQTASHAQHSIYYLASSTLDSLDKNLLLQFTSSVIRLQLKLHGRDDLVYEQVFARPTRVTTERKISEDATHMHFIR